MISMSVEGGFGRRKLEWPNDGWGIILQLLFCQGNGGGGGGKDLHVICVDDEFRV